jgi:2-C-methyl-D-erythritol 2,4-cyclodiphosphate synthase
MRIGFGYDSHRLAAGRALVIGGVEIPHESGLLGHSDADVLLHALCDALLGAVGEADIGRQFPDTDPAYRGISSLLLLGQVCRRVRERGYRVGNVDATVVLERPKLSAHIPEMVRLIAATCSIDVTRVSVKAKTNEGMGFVGSGEGAAVFAVVTVEEAV